MKEVMGFLGFDDITRLAAVTVAFIGVCAFLVALVVEAAKSIRCIDRLPTKLVCYVVALLLTTPVFLAVMSYLSQQVEWYMILASFLLSFVVAKVSMSGWDDVTELYHRMISGK